LSDWPTIKSGAEQLIAADIRNILIAVMVGEIGSNSIDLNDLDQWFPQASSRSRNHDVELGGPANFHFSPGRRFSKFSAVRRRSVHGRLVSGLQVSLPRFLKCLVQD
jgi:hypothetical protein